ncbi:hypothetical protein CAPTEDRAFT_217700 [Capitella teleta]|uniref:Uncharacterized protein n=1 Tax=Capitella teleta TaxID=283909 RepID=X2AMJ9_CAPTE|nr:hypothetical protein CAPTEDRAFT_217700 [Capitella teleta]|eukprot:ELU00316.1 hypothetical protein CAPTEDRAFT_217700 [Capitella teleta]
MKSREWNTNGMKFRIFNPKMKGEWLRRRMHGLMGHFELQGARVNILDETQRLQSFVSANATNKRRVDLQCCTRKQEKLLLSHNQCFCELGKDAYPGERKAKEVDVLFWLYAIGLRDRKLVEKIVTTVKPDMLDTAQQQVATEAKTKQHGLARLRADEGGWIHAYSQTPLPV